MKQELRNTNNDFSELHNKCILDFTNDKEYIGVYCFIQDETEYRKEMKEKPTMNAFALMQVAEKSGDTALKSAVEKEFKHELDAYFNE